MKKLSQVCVALCCWVKAIETFYREKQIVLTKQEKQKELIKSVAEKIASVLKLRDAHEKRQKELSQLEEEFYLREKAFKED
jgi:hypothetical protein